MSSDAPCRVLAGPIGLEPEWRWTRKDERPLAGAAVGARAGGVGGVAAGGVGPPATTLAYRAELVAVREQVELAAGTFDAVHVRVHVDDATEPVEDVWYARGLGIVKRVVNRDGASAEWLLVGFTAGAAPVDPDAVLRRFLAEAPVLAARGAPDEIAWVPLEDEGWVLRSAFARIAWGDEHVVVRVLGDVASLFAPSDASQYTALHAQENLAAQPWKHFGPAGDGVLALAGLAGRLQAYEMGLSDPHGLRVRKMSLESANDVRDVLALLDATDATGNRVVLQSHLRLENGAVTELEVVRAP